MLYLVKINVLIGGTILVNYLGYKREILINDKLCIALVKIIYIVIHSWMLKFRGQLSANYQLNIKDPYF